MKAVEFQDRLGLFQRFHLAPKSAKRERQINSKISRLGLNCDGLAVIFNGVFVVALVVAQVAVATLRRNMDSAVPKHATAAGPLV